MSASAYRDSPTGMQFCTRYRPAHDPDHVYWWYVRTDAEEAEQDAQWLREHGGSGVEVFERDLTPWRPRRTGTGTGTGEAA